MYIGEASITYPNEIQEVVSSPSDDVRGGKHLLPTGLCLLFYYLVFSIIFYIQYIY